MHGFKTVTDTGSTTCYLNVFIMFIEKPLFLPTFIIHVQPEMHVNARTGSVYHVCITRMRSAHK